MPPVVSAAALVISSAVASGRRIVLGNGFAKWCVVTGNARPSDVITGASFSIAATGPASSVADMTTIYRSSRNAFAISQVSARPKSAFSERS